MPVYEYKCNKCGREFEYTQKITENALVNCPPEICEEEIKGEGKVERKISRNVGLVFKGSGFYLTDYARKHTDFNNGNGKKPGTASETKTETKTESKSETAKETPVTP